MQDRAQRIELPDGTEVWARVSRLDAPGLDGTDPLHGDEDGDGDDWGFEDVGAWDALGARVEGLREVIGGVAASVRQAAARVAPHETSVTFGVELSAKPGKAVALLADGEAKTNLSITLTWRQDRQGDRDRQADQGRQSDQDRRPGHGPDGGAPRPEPQPEPPAAPQAEPPAGRREPDDAGR
ncbi:MULTISPECIES: CU044_2847 family protein [Streptomyces]|uniref:CU044_2847 family protein n=1 Tax=Streptomyces TaxID=1883 RepID=UPI001F36CCE9|nr:CU044_2847 family protein [Streptomyces sp. 9-7]